MPENLTYKALLVVFEAVHACSKGPVKLSLGLRFALAYLFTAMRSADAQQFKRFAAAIADAHTGQTEYIGNYIRALEARRFLNLFMEGVGLLPTLENETKLRKSFEKLTSQPHPDPPSQQRKG